MLHARRAAMAEASCTATLAAIGITSIHAASTRTTQGQFDRELHLRVSDGFTRQSWRNGLQTWNETRDTLAMEKDEIVRITIVNDTPAVRVVSLGDGRAMLRIRPGDAACIDLFVDSFDPFEIAVVGQPPLSRPVRVRGEGLSLRQPAAD
ncbi:MAG: hypothetical protein Q8R82_08295 [Hyphomonadaceae bacterium]|nr:hypothetical protein [Hyphomonadaceae bacterium]